jgi:hypothetical protein
MERFHEMAAHMPVTSKLITLAVVNKIIDMRIDCDFPEGIMRSDRAVELENNGTHHEDRRTDLIHHTRRSHTL